ELDVARSGSPARDRRRGKRRGGFGGGVGFDVRHRAILAGPTLPTVSALLHFSRTTTKEPPMSATRLAFVVACLAVPAFAQDPAPEAEASAPEMSPEMAASMAAWEAAGALGPEHAELA